ncbi:MAG: AmmeMemoRadiSam system radical SAM enzyme [bacterium]
MVSLARSFLLLALLAAPGRNSAPPGREARFYTKLERGVVRCELCPRACVLPPGGRGACRARENRDGRLISLVYGRPATVGKEPIEKSPFFHFLPGTLRLTLATAGCNQTCKYCQNWELSQSRPEDLPAYDLPPDSVLALALREGVPTICLTYSEPVVFLEYACDIARAARRSGLRTAVVTGGYCNPGPFAELCSLVDAVKIDLKGFTESFYQDVCGSSLAPVLAACRVARASGTHFELVNLVVPSLNDDSAAVAAMCRWLADSLGRDIPIHFTRFSPAYRLANAAPTPVATLERCVRIARAAGLEYAYVGNVPGHERENTDCPDCDARLISRTGYRVGANRLVAGHCPDCGKTIPGVWQ